MRAETSTTPSSTASARTIVRALRRIIAGPSEVIVVGALSSVASPRGLLGRPVEVRLDESAVLTTHLQLPREALRNAPDAASLHLEQETPFNARDLHIATTVFPRADDLQEVDVRVDAVPRALVAEALVSARISIRRVSRIVGIGESSETVFPFRTPTARWFGFAASLTPVVLILSLVLFAGWREQAAWQRQLDAIRTALAQTTNDFRVMEAQRRALEETKTRFESYDSIFAGSPSSFLLLSALKKTWPSSATAQSVSISAGIVRIRARSADVLATISELKSTRTWDASLDGTIAADPMGGESGVLRLVHR